MNDKHYKVALILLTLPLSFGGGTAGGTSAKAIGAADANNQLSLKEPTRGHRGFQPADVPGRFDESLSGFADGWGRSPSSFVSSFGASGIKRNANCLGAITEGPEADRLNGDCFPARDNSGVGNSSMGFPMYNSSKNSEISQHSHEAGSARPISVEGGFFGGVSGGGSGSGPTSTPTATPEPGSFVLLAGGLIMLVGLARRRQRGAA